MDGRARTDQTVDNMTKKKAPVAPPIEAMPDGETNLYLAKFKSSLSKRWSLTRMGTLYEISDLIQFLWALGRTNDAIAVADSVADSIPCPPPLPGGGFNYNIWCPATFSHAMVAHLSGSHARAAASRTAIFDNTGISRDNPDYIAANIEGARQLVNAPAGQDTIKWECQGLAGTLATLVLYFELAKAGDILFKPHSEKCDSLIPGLLSKLNARLRST